MVRASVPASDSQATPKNTQFEGGARPRQRCKLLLLLVSGGGPPFPRPRGKAEGKSMSEQENTGPTLEGLAQRPETLERHNIPPSRLTPRLDGWEVTQAIQDINHTVTLIASKRTVVRTYLSSPRVGSRVTVRGELALRRSPGGPPVTIPSLNRVARG